MSHDELVQLLARREACELQILKFKRELVELNNTIENLREELARREIPCWTCTKPQADDARHWLRNSSGPNRESVSGSGLPMSCCRVFQSAIVVSG